MDLCDLILTVLYNCFDAIVTAITIFLCIDIIIHLFKTYTKRKLSLIYITIILVSILLKSITNFHSNFYILKIILAIISIPLVLKYVFHFRYQQYLIGITTALVFFTFVELESLILAKYLNVDLEYLCSNYLYKYVITFLTSMSQFTLLVVTYTLFKKHYKYYDLDNYNIQGIMPQLLSIAICLVPIVLLVSVIKLVPPTIIIAMTSIQLCVITCVGMYNILRNIKHSQIKQALDETLTHNKNLKQTNDDIRGYKHDISNIIQSVVGYVNCNDMIGLKEYCNNLLIIDSNINTMASFPPEKINEPAIYGVVCGKLCEAKDKKLELVVDIEEDFKMINFSKHDLARTLGILLDNAIYAASNTKNGKIMLSIYYDEKRKQDKIIIANSVSNFNFDIDKIFEKDYSTKSNPSGFGLYEIKKLLNLNPQAQIIPVTDNQNMLFSQTLIIDRNF